jgi:hypothetical protein
MAEPSVPVSSAAPTLPDPQQDPLGAFQALVSREMSLVEKFLEHLDLARNFSDDPRIATFIEHTMDEEREHLDKLRAIAATSEQIANAAGTHVLYPGSVPPVPSLTPDPDGHYQRRDQNVLTVGSLLGHPQ